MYEIKPRWAYGAEANVSPSFRTAMSVRVARTMVSVMKLTEPSTLRTLTPPPWADVKPHAGLPEDLRVRLIPYGRVVELR